MSDVADVSNALIKMQEELTSLQTAVDAINTAKDISLSSVKSSLMVVKKTEELIAQVQTLVRDVSLLDLDSKLEIISQLTESLGTGFESTESKLKAYIDITEKNTANNIELVTKLIEEKHSVLESIIRELQVAVLKQQLETQEYNSKLNKSILVMQILAGIALVLIIVQIVLNYVG